MLKTATVTETRHSFFQKGRDRDKYIENGCIIYREEEGRQDIKQDTMKGAGER